jgi:hypothetical protein
MGTLSMFHDYLYYEITKRRQSDNLLNKLLKEITEVKMKRELRSDVPNNLLYGLIDCIIYAFIAFVFIAGMNVIIEQDVHAQTHADSQSSIVQIKEGDEWRYFKGIQKPPLNWNRGGFDDKNWQTGPSGFGYGQGMNRTYLGDMQGNYSTVYARRALAINNIYNVTGMTLSLVCDGAFIAYLNGMEIIRNSSSLQRELFDVSGFIHELLPGKNVLSVECTNDNINSNDFSFIPFFEVLEYQGGAIQ